jgi:hypothetical protein
MCESYLKISIISSCRSTKIVGVPLRNRENFNLKPCHTGWTNGLANRNTLGVCPLFLGWPPPGAGSSEPGGLAEWAASPHGVAGLLPSLKERLWLFGKAM